MRKIYVTIVCKSSTKEIFNVSFHHKGNVINFTQGKKAYASIHDMIIYILRLAKANEFTIDFRESFGATWYNIFWIDIDKPEKIECYPCY